MDFSLLLTYLVAITLLTLTPGVDTFMVVRNSSRGGWRDGVVTSVGICSGLFVHAVISAVGISVILLQTAWAFSALKLAGAGYLIWLGGVSWKEAVVGRRDFIDAPATAGMHIDISSETEGYGNDRTTKPPIPPGDRLKRDVGKSPVILNRARSFREGFLSNVLNPKAVVFYMAFLPQFINPAGNALIQSLALAGGHFIIAMIWQAILAVAVDRAGRKFQTSRGSRILSGVTGSVLIALGVGLAFARK